MSHTSTLVRRLLHYKCLPVYCLALGISHTPLSPLSVFLGECEWLLGTHTMTTASLMKVPVAAELMTMVGSTDTFRIFSKDMCVSHRLHYTLHTDWQSVL
jgi:hypothetical protein